MDPKGKGMVVNDKEKESIFNEPRDGKPTDSSSSHKGKGIVENRMHFDSTDNPVFINEQIHKNAQATTVFHCMEKDKFLNRREVLKAPSQSGKAHATYSISEGRA